MATSIDLRNCSMEDIVKEAWALRTSFDLQDVSYGRIHWGNERDIRTEPFPYYYFLAGLVKLTRAERVVEIGTHQGGSARALARGFEHRPGKVVTLDVTQDGAKMFAADPTIRAYTCDANTEAAYDIVVGEFGEPKIDLVFIDTLHNFWQTFESFLFYGMALGPKIAVFDDITLNDSMKKLWQYIGSRLGTENTIDATLVHEVIRAPDAHSRPGFGVVRFP